MVRWRYFSALLLLCCSLFSVAKPKEGLAILEASLTPTAATDTITVASPSSPGSPPSYPRIVVSLTTTPARISGILATLKSLLQQTLQPDVIYLHIPALHAASNQVSPASMDLLTPSPPQSVCPQIHNLGLQNPRNSALISKEQQRAADRPRREGLRPHYQAVTYPFH